MPRSGAVDGFVASRNGFRFTNSFPSEPAVTIDLGPLGKVGLGDASQGVCGGMAFAVRDYFEAGEDVPPDTSPPPKGSPLFDYIVRRLIDSFDAPQGVARYLEWMARSATDTKVLMFTHPGTVTRTIHETWSAVRADIDAGHPSPLGLVPLHSTDVRKVGHCHQVLAYAYDVDDSNRLTLSICDPNTGTDGADDVRISLPLDGSGGDSAITHNVNIPGSTLHGFFRSEYSAARPPTR